MLSYTMPVRWSRSDQKHFKRIGLHALGSLACPQIILHGYQQSPMLFSRTRLSRTGQSSRASMRKSMPNFWKRRKLLAKVKDVEPTKELEAKIDDARAGGNQQDNPPP
ncbi:hypothetical protein Acr_15g0002150 [Actinidia rufa]|uniref:Uncharacterized protein n=1 Tax=Actinidia rufa TaxID=165716 RepID=A0A7J0FSC1_9ERIC|nr:hypothetical protein Acr_15g0002150 [Actinidia rufa]